MATLYIGSANVEAGTEYAGLTGTANAMQLTEDVRISINRSPFANFPAHTKLFIAQTFSYSFEKATTVLFSNEIEPDFYVTTNEYNHNDIPLVSDTESATIVSVVDEDGREVTTGSIAAFALVSNSANQEGACIIRIYGSTLGEITSISQDIPANSPGTNVVISHTIVSSAPLPAGESIYFTLEASNGSMQVEGTTTPSQVAIQRRNL